MNNNDGDLFEDLFAKLNSTPIEPADDPHSRLAGLIGFFDHLIDVGKNASTFAGMKDAERAQLLTAMKDVKTHRKAVIEYFRRSDHPTLDASILRLLIAAYHIGEFANASDTAKGTVGRPGGNKRGTVIAGDADKKWRTDAKQMGDRLLKADPRLTITDVANHVMKVCPGVPEFDQVYRYLLSVLPSRTKRKQRLTKGNSRPPRTTAKIQENRA